MSYGVREQKELGLPFSGYPLRIRKRPIINSKGLLHELAAHKIIRVAACLTDGHSDLFEALEDSDVVVARYE